MIDRIAALVVDESRWLPLSMIVALAAVALLLRRSAGPELPPRRLVLAAMNLFFGVMIGIMAFGHLLAVTTKLATGTLAGRAPLLYAIGVLLLLPAIGVVRHTRQILASQDHGRATLALNAWLGTTLLVLGVHNLPLAVPALLNGAYQLHSRPRVGWAIVALAVVATTGLFIGSLVFMASGQSFEQFTGID